jgi:hypothetical protein
MVSRLTPVVLCKPWQTMPSESPIKMVSTPAASATAAKGGVISREHGDFFTPCAHVGQARQADGFARGGGGGFARTVNGGLLIHGSNLFLAKN